MMDPFFIPVLVAGVLGGASAGLLGVFIVGMRMPFVGVCVSHAAMAGAVGAVLMGWPQMPCALALAVATSGSLGLVRVAPGRGGTDSNVALGVLFSLMMGLTFLGIGLAPGPKTAMLGLLWGSLVFVGARDVWITAGCCVGLMVFVAAFYKEMRSILFSRFLAAASGVHETFVYTLFLGLTGLVLTVNLQAVGGLMIFSLITNPAAAALRLCRGFRALCLVAAVLGAASALGGFLASYWLDLPTGACIVLLSTFLFALASAWRRHRGEAA
ncbi:MAG: metal ABC transporter permease [Candidatus Brocadiia bacterium]